MEKLVGRIYALLDPRVSRETIWAIKYIGLTRESLEDRLRKHLSTARKSTRDYYNMRWIRSLLSNGLRPIIVELECLPVGRLPQREMEWIAAHRAVGCLLTNATEGGDGCHGISEETRQKLRGRVKSEETRRKLSVALTGKKRSAEICAKFSAIKKGTGKGRVKSEDTRRKLSEAMKGKRHPPEVIAKIVAKTKGRKRKPLSEETKQKMSEAHKGNKRWLGKHHSEATKAKCSLAKIGNTARLGQPHLEETKRKISEAHAGEKSSSAKVTWEQVREIRNCHGEGLSNAKIGQKFGLSTGTVWSIVNHKTWINDPQKQEGTDGERLRRHSEAVRARCGFWEDFRLQMG